VSISAHAFMELIASLWAALMLSPAPSMPCCLASQSMVTDHLANGFHKSSSSAADTPTSAQGILANFWPLFTSKLTVPLRQPGSVVNPVGRSLSTTIVSGVSTPASEKGSSQKTAVLEVMTSPPQASTSLCSSAVANASSLKAPRLPQASTAVVSAESPVSADLSRLAASHHRVVGKRYKRGH
jgi:hypothetical protein